MCGAVFRRLAQPPSPPHPESARQVELDGEGVVEKVLTGGVAFTPCQGRTGWLFQERKAMTEKQEEPCWKRQKRESRERIKQKIARESGRYCI